MLDEADDMGKTHNVGPAASTGPGPANAGMY